MAIFWNSIHKLIKCVDTYWNFGKTKNLSKNPLFCWYNRRKCENLRKPHLFSLVSLSGFIGSREKKRNQDTTEEVLHNVALATMALKDGNIQKSEKMFKDTLDLAESNNFPSTVISTCDILSSLAMKLGDYEKAEDFLIRAVNKLLSQGASEENNAVISFNLKLSKLYSKNGNDPLAEVGFRNCIKLLKSKIQNGTDDQDALLLWVTILFWYGKFLAQRNRYEEAKSCFQDIYQDSYKIEKLTPSQMVVILYNLGEVCRLLGELDSATEYLLKGVSLAKKFENPDLSYFYSKLGEVSLSKELYKDAKVWCDMAQKLAKRDGNREAEVESKECLQKLNVFFVS